MLFTKTEDRRPFGETTDGKTILMSSLEKQVMRMWTGFI
jgi:hypothetical protein